MIKQDLFDHINSVEVSVSSIQSSPPTVKRGIMKKYSRKGLFRNWKSRFFILESGYLYYYESSKNSEPYGINLKGQMSLINSSVSLVQSQQKSGRIGVCGGSGERDILLEAKPQKEWSLWMQLMKEHCEYATMMYNKYSAAGMPRHVSFHRFMTICSEVEERQSLSVQSNAELRGAFKSPVVVAQSIPFQKILGVVENNSYEAMGQSSSKIKLSSNGILPIATTNNNNHENVGISQQINNSRDLSPRINREVSNAIEVTPKANNDDARQSKLQQIFVSHPMDYETSSEYLSLSHAEKVEVTRLKEDMDRKEKMERQKRERLIAFVSTDGYEKSAEYENLSLQERLELSLLREEEVRKNKFLSQKQEKLNAFLDRSNDGQLVHVPLTPNNHSTDGFKTLTLSQRLQFLRSQEEKEKKAKLESEKKLKLNAFLSIPTTPQEIDDNSTAMNSPDESVSTPVFSERTTKASVTERFEKAKIQQQINTEQRLVSMKIVTSPTVTK